MGLLRGTWLPIWTSTEFTLPCKNTPSPPLFWYIDALHMSWGVPPPPTAHPTPPPDKNIWVMLLGTRFKYWNLTDLVSVNPVGTFLLCLSAQIPWWMKCYSCRMRSFSKSLCCWWDWQTVISRGNLYWMSSYNTGEYWQSLLTTGALPVLQRQMAQIIVTWHIFLGYSLVILQTWEIPLKAVLLWTCLASSNLLPSNWSGEWVYWKSLLECDKCEAVFLSSA
jgi:hypothetical protein